MAQALEILERHLRSSLHAVYLYGSAVDGGLRPLSDIDLFVTVTAGLDLPTRPSLANELLEISAPPAADSDRRALEVTIVVLDDIAPWRYPPRRELQFGEWQRQDILAGIIEPAVTDPDLAILLAKLGQHSVALKGPPAVAALDPVPRRDLFRALADTLDQWHGPQDWSGDERNVVLALARIG